MGANNIFQDIAGNPYSPGTQITEQPLYATQLSQTGGSQSTPPTAQEQVSNIQLLKQSLGTFELSSAPYNLTNYPVTQYINNANQNVYGIGWINLNFAGLINYYQGAVNTKSFALLNTQITSQGFYITDIQTEYFEPDYGFNNYTILINGTPVPAFTNFRNNNNKHNPEGYSFSNATSFALSVSSITGLIQPVAVTILGYGTVSNNYNDGVSSTLSSLQILT